MKFSENSGVWTLCGLRRWRYAYRQASLCTVHITADPMSASVTSICRHVAGHWYNRQQHVRHRGMQRARRRLPLSQGTEPRATLHATHAHSVSSPFCSFQVNGSRSHVQAPRPVPPLPSLPRNCCTKRGETSLLCSCIPQRAGARRLVARALERQQGSFRDPLLLQKPAHYSCVSFRDQWSVARVLWPWLRALAPTAFPPQCEPARLPSACVRRQRERERELAFAYHV